MKYSNSIAHIASALSTFQSLVKNPKKESVNPHFKSKYADLDAMINTIRPTLEKCGLSFVQNPTRDETSVGVSTILLHKSGEFIEFDPVMIPLKQQTPHQVGAAMTYARRYSLGAALGIATEQDLDGTGDGPGRPQERSQASKAQGRGTGNTPRPLPHSWNKLSELNGVSGQDTGLIRKRFFAICNKKGITDKQQKAIVYLYTQKGSRKDVTFDEYKEINRDIERATHTDIYHMVVQALKLKKSEKELA